MKSYLVSRGISFEKTHDLLYLHKLCVNLNADFSEILASCLTLNPYAVITRYPSELELIDQDAISAIESTRLIRTIVLKKMID